MNGLRLIGRDTLSASGRARLTGAGVAEAAREASRRSSKRSRRRLFIRQILFTHPLRLKSAEPPGFGRFQHISKTGSFVKTPQQLAQGLVFILTCPAIIECRLQQFQRLTFQFSHKPLTMEFVKGLANPFRHAGPQCRVDGYGIQIIPARCAGHKIGAILGRPGRQVFKARGKNFQITRKCRLLLKPRVTKSGFLGKREPCVFLIVRQNIFADITHGAFRCRPIRLNMAVRPFADVRHLHRGDTSGEGRRTIGIE